MGDERGHLRGVPSPDDRYARLARRFLRRFWADAPAGADEPPRGLTSMVRRRMVSDRRRRLAVRLSLGVTGAVVASAAMIFVGFSLARRSRPMVAVAPPAAGASPSASGTVPPLARASIPAIALPDAVPDPGPMFVVADGAGPVSASAEGVAVRVGAPLAAPPGRTVRLTDALGTELALEPGASMTPVAIGAERLFALAQGAVRVRVAPLVAGQRFVVTTADTEVEVHGTQFRVATVDRAEPCAATLTRVSVVEGMVTVRPSGAAVRAAGTSRATNTGEIRLRPGEHWPRACSPFRAPAGSPSSLQLQNDLFHAAVRAKRGGDRDLAGRLYERFVHQYPDSSLVESAMAEEMRLAAASDPAAGVRVARQYLTRFPDGFARLEARALVDRKEAARP